MTIACSQISSISRPDGEEPERYYACTQVGRLTLGGTILERKSELRPVIQQLRAEEDGP